MVSQKQIGAELGISYTLVSKVLSGRMGTTGVTPALREAIVRKAKELNYRPNQLAVNLKRGRRGAIGVFLHSMGIRGSELSLDFLNSVAAALAQSGERMILRFFETDEELLSNLDACRYDTDGLLVGGVNHPDLLSKFEQMDADGFPIVCAPSGTPARCTASTIVVDNEEQGRLATLHLLQQGCRRLVNLGDLYSRRDGFEKAHAEMGVKVDPRLLKRTKSFSVAHGEEALAEMVQAGLKFDGIVAQSDSLAVGAMRVVLAQGLRVPQDVRVTGVDDSPICDSCAIPLTSVSSEIKECGRVAVQLLTDKIAGKRVNRIVIKPRLIVRASSQ